MKTWIGMIAGVLPAVAFATACRQPSAQPSSLALRGAVGQAAATCEQLVCVTQSYAHCAKGSLCLPRAIVRLRERAALQVSLSGTPPRGAEGCRVPGRATVLAVKSRVVEMELMPLLPPSPRGAMGVCRAMPRMSARVVVGPLDAGEWTLDAGPARIQVLGATPNP